jgi:phosphotriesterase-related protein
VRIAQADMTSRRDFLKRTAIAALAMAVSRPAAGASGMVQTVLGPLDASKLGFTLTHEHIADGPDFLKKWPKGWGGRTEFTAKAVDRLKSVRAGGVGTIVDLTTYDVGRDIRFLEEGSQKSGIHMVAATGKRLFPPDNMDARTTEELTEFFIREIRQGIDGTTIKAGVIKVATLGHDVTVLEDRALRAAARASKATGLPIETHTRANMRGGEKQAGVFEAEGVDPARVSLGHSDDSGDMGYFLGLVRRGYTLGMDHVHRGIDPNLKPSFERRAECIKLLADAGFADKIFLSQDAEFGGSLLPEETRGWRERIDPRDGMLFITHQLIPHLERIGVSERDIHAMTVENPRYFFSSI